MDLINPVQTYKQLGIGEVIDHEKSNLISIDHHSTRIEGSTLTAMETQVLINEGLTPKGKPLQDSLMVTDHHAALLFTLETAKAKQAISVELIQAINALVMKNTGTVYNTMLGNIDSRTGAFIKGNVSAGSSYFPNYDKVKRLTNDLSTALSTAMTTSLSLQQQLDLSFDAHFNLVSIHLFYDGNGRTSRLLMNFIQAYYNLPLAIVYSETKAEYYDALIVTREKEDISIFRQFMSNEYSKLLSHEIKKFKEMDKPKKGKGFSLLF